jgi:hypothetical protein
VRERPSEVETIVAPRPHKFTGANDFIGLAALLRNFFRAQLSSESRRADLRDSRIGGF